MVKEIRWTGMLAFDRFVSLFTEVDGGTVHNKHDGRSQNSYEVHYRNRKRRKSPELSGVRHRDGKVTVAPRAIIYTFDGMKRLPKGRYTIDNPPNEDGTRQLTQAEIKLLVQHTTLSQVNGWGSDRVRARLREPNPYNERVVNAVPVYVRNPT